ncbi:fluoride efflux transporter FluC [Novipirellula artificiosorum]|uniref:Fluoride-specific ion channel FluC n=1 Tax=Novipirellula artificiosorum TaxID=2528016 RepID=A0A5C6DHF1_9BACT|nr:CrcB family protein [Novipirellula artificiosorum]TWU35131.1 putative fluoride ion transporter CrcB [Novipirellula artificiosorum]
MTTWSNLVAVAAGGACGAVARYGITLTAIAIPGSSAMVGTTIANVIGCAAIGGLAEYCAASAAISPAALLGLRVGFLGALTTFSTFAAESIFLADEQRWLAASVYVAANLFLGWAALLGTLVLVKGWMA